MRLRLNRFTSALATFALTLTAAAQTNPATPANSATPPNAAPRTKTSPLPRIVQQDGRFALLVDGAPYLMLSAQVHNSSAWPAVLPQVWPIAAQLHLNTLEAPIYWEQFEPAPGHFDTSALHALLVGARQHNLHLVLLWFGTWKNGSGHYTPQWLKLNEAQYPHVTGPTGRKVDSLSPNAPATLAADLRAFTTFMHELKLADPQHTVLMVQVENEAGTYGSVRDFSPLAQQAFNAQVPQAALTAMHKAQPGTWHEVFGTDADEYFHAWSIASFIQQLAAAGKREYPLPLYVNDALRDPIKPGPASTYESGGPTDNVIPLWKAAAPSIDLIGPDNYAEDYAHYTRALDLYARPDNPFMVPESSNRPLFARFAFAAIGHGAFGFAPFGMDRSGYRGTDKVSTDLTADFLTSFASTFALLAPIQRQIAAANFAGHLQAVAEDPNVHATTLNFGTWQASIAYGMPQFGFGSTPPGNTPADGGVLIAQLGPNEFLLTAQHARIDFHPTDKALQRQFLAVEEGTYINGRWTATRIWNGDQTDYGINFTDLPQVLRVKLATY